MLSLRIDVIEQDKRNQSEKLAIYTAHFIHPTYIVPSFWPMLEVIGQRASFFLRDAQSRRHSPSPTYLQLHARYERAPSHAKNRQCPQLPVCFADSAPSTKHQAPASQASPKDSTLASRLQNGKPSALCVLLCPRVSANPRPSAAGEEEVVFLSHFVALGG